MYHIWVLWPLVIFAGSFAFIDTSKDFCHYLVSCLSIVNLFSLSALSICFYQLYLSPLGELTGRMEGPLANKLVHCVIDHIPELSSEFNSIADCLNDVKVYMVRNGRVPYMPRVPTAFVMSSDLDSVFVTNYYIELDVYSKALVMIHECAHLGLHAVDYAYMWEESFNNLTHVQHYNNADSFMKLVSDYC